MDILTTIHQFAGYVIALVVLASATAAFGRAHDAREFTAGPYVAAAVLLDVQVTLGLVIYGVGGYWDHASPLLRYVHPLLAVLALVAAHVGVRRGRAQRMAAEAHQAAGRGLLVALVLVFGAVMASTVGVRGLI
ncbi:hypothetical protein [Egicoccus halophilus]|uniref:Uncharacterized protein n=1 Tax=Egicoccus halophilus TaxID=1670830 RepID=A0A8J3AD94_9ACTN|nr:hypothetical protein [Egicoccus halophilus]GGI04477.1 hypothetical protein GCM10011354_09290 [Egicoccus halophilus]